MLNSQVLTMKKPSRASFLPPPSSINGPTAHYRLQKYTVSVSHLFHLQPSRCVWAPECMAASGGGGVSVLMQCVGGGDEWPYDSNISHLPARAADGNAELRLLVSVSCRKPEAWKHKRVSAMLWTCTLCFCCVSLLKRGTMKMTSRFINWLIMQILSGAFLFFFLLLLVWRSKPGKTQTWYSPLF